jgi:plasmid maintenance system antidote protein VapI
MTPSTALRLAKFFGMSEGFWMNLQLRCDLYRARRSEEKELKAIEPFSHCLPNSINLKLNTFITL